MPLNVLVNFFDIRGLSWTSCRKKKTEWSWKDLDQSKKGVDFQRYLNSYP